MKPKSNFQAPGQQTEKVRESAGWEFKISNQIDSLMRAINSGDKTATESALLGLNILVKSYMNPADVEKYEQVTYRPMRVEQIYSNEDIDRVKKYGKLPMWREKELRRQLSFENQILFFQCARKQADIIMVSLKAIGLGLEVQEAAIL